MTHTNVTPIDNDESVRNFFLRSMRAWGMCWFMDEAGVPEEVLPQHIEGEFEDTKWQAKLADQTQKLDEMLEHDDAWWDKFAADTRAARETRNAQIMAKAEPLRRHYQHLLNKVRDWTPPTPEHKHYQDRMVAKLMTEIENLEIGIMPTDFTSAELRNEQIETQRDIVEWAQLQLDGRRKKFAKDKAWINAVIDSLPED